MLKKIGKDTARAICSTKAVSEVVHLALDIRSPLEKSIKAMKWPRMGLKCMKTCVCVTDTALCGRVWP